MKRANRASILLGCMAVAFGLCVLSAICGDLSELWFFVACGLIVGSLYYFYRGIERRWGKMKRFYPPDVLWRILFFSPFLLILYAGLELVSPPFLHGFYWWNTGWAPLCSGCLIVLGCIEGFAPSVWQAWRKERSRQNTG
ncbi:hypothetical protein [Trueperella sp. LYQ141]|uniref:hypothetical protein n=1 Tax=Trueperella sp. LYQ141 TaxID=3391058 RepID=UPI0039835D37